MLQKMTSQMMQPENNVGMNIVWRLSRSTNRAKQDGQVPLEDDREEDCALACDHRRTFVQRIAFVVSKFARL